MFVSQDISTKYTHCLVGIVSNKLSKFGVNLTTISYSCHRNDRLEISI